MFHYSHTRTGYSPSSAPSNSLVWSQSLTGSIQSSPAISDSQLYVGTMDGYIYCLDTDTGETIWSNTTSGGIITRSSPAVADDKVVLGAKDGKVYCFDADTGDLEWSHTTGAAIVSSPVVVNGYVYIGSNDNRLYCLNADTGNRQWSYATDDDVTSSAAVSDIYVYFGSNDNSVYCIHSQDSNTPGSLRWSYETQDSVSSTPAIQDGKVYIGSSDNHLYCLDAGTGDQLWNTTTGDAIYSSPAIAGTYVYVGSEDHSVYCLHKNTGEQQWSVPTGGNVQSSPAVAGDYVYVASYDHSLYCLDASTGDEVWNQDLNAQITASSAIADGYLFITTQSDSDNVYCFGGDNQPPNTPHIPQGPATGEQGTVLTFTSRASDPDQDDVYLKFKFGDGSTGDWIGPYESGETVAVTHSYEENGVYEITVKAKDTHDEESDWSTAFSITIQETPTDPSLFIAVSPETIYETDSFTVTVTDDSQTVVSDATVTFHQEAVLTDQQGQVSFIAPAVADDTSFTISATKEGYQGTQTVIMINDADHAVETGFIYGRVTDTEGVFLADVRVCFMSENDETTKTCTFTNTTGVFSKELPSGTYAMSAKKPGYESYMQTNIIVNPGETLGININLESLSTPLTDEETLAALAINEAIKNGHVGASITVSSSAQPTAEYYQDALNVHTIEYAAEEGVSLTVEAPSGTQATFVIIEIDDSDFSTEDIVVTYDGAEIAQISLSQFINPSELSEPKYVILGTADGNHIGVFVPSFSAHTITITSSAQTILMTLLVMYILGILVAGLIFVVPEYVTYFKKVKE